MRDANHVSAAIYCMSNELGTGTLYPKSAWKCYFDTKSIKPQAMVLWTDGGYSPDLPADFVNAEARLDRECKKPLIQHEFRWWSAHPDPGIRHKYRGAVRPYAAEILQRAAEERAITSLLPRMIRNSQRLQYIEARGKLEACRRDNPSLAGICHFTAMDIGFSPQGILDEFYEKKYVEPDMWIKTWDDCVLLISKDFDERVLACGDLLKASIFVSDFSHPSFKRPRLMWAFHIGPNQSASGTIEYRHRPFLTRRAGCIELKVPRVRRPTKATLRAILEEEGRTCENEWDFWVFPPQPSIPSSAAIYHGRRGWLRRIKGVKRIRSIKRHADQELLLTDVLDQDLLEYVKAGGRVILAAGEGLTRPFPPKLGLSKGRYFFLPPANYPPHESGNAGTVINDHPMLGDLPHEGFADLQIYRPIAESPPIDLAVLGGWSTATVIRALSSYLTLHPLAYVAEFSIGSGGMIITSLDLDQRWPEARYLLCSMVEYVSGPGFKPGNRLDDEGVERLMKACDLDADPRRQE